jgi:predicted transglutaminase-like cysteine proteinase
VEVLKLRGAFLIGTAFGGMCGLVSTAYVISSSARALTSGCGSRAGEAQLLCVTRETNKAIVSTNDFDHYGIDDVWVENPVDGKGDCEDFVLTKARVLQQLGWSPARMQVAVFGYGEQAHAVLLVDDKYVLDNLTPWVGRWKGYSLTAMGVYPIDTARSLTRFTPHLMTASIRAR